MRVNVPLLVISLRVEGVISTSFLSSERFGSVSTALSCRDMSKFSVMPGLFQNLLLYYRFGLQSVLWASANRSVNW